MPRETVERGGPGRRALQDGAGGGIVHGDGPVVAGCCHAGSIRRPARIPDHAVSPVAPARGPGDECRLLLEPARLLLVGETREGGDRGVAPAVALGVDVPDLDAATAVARDQRASVR